jgi:hypothetical protein
MMYREGEVVSRVLRLFVAGGDDTGVARSSDAASGRLHCTGRIDGGMSVELYNVSLFTLQHDRGKVRIRIKT